MEPLDVVFAYHERTKHYPGRFARALGYLDWATQPDPFRRFEGASRLRLDEIPPTREPAYEALFGPGLPPKQQDCSTVSQLFYDSLALSAWKEYGQARWSLRANPSSGNLHPTEAYLVSGPLPGLSDAPAIYHYSPYEHALEARAELSPAEWDAVAARLPSGANLMGLTSIHWRESWKYGERAFRYCHHDVGHAIGAVSLAAATLGWEARLLEGVPSPEIATLLGTDRQEGSEAEHADCLLALYPRGEPFPAEAARTFRLPPALLTRLATTPFAGEPNRLSRDHHPWPVIDEVSRACIHDGAPNADPWTAPAPPVLPARSDSPPAREVIRQRRSAVDMDGRTSISRDAFYRMLSRVLSTGAPPCNALPWRPRVHLLLFVHRVRDLVPGLYLLVRHRASAEGLRTALDPRFAWERPPDCPAGLDLHLLQRGDCRDVARAASCAQDIAADGAFAVAMLAEFEGPLREFGPSFYPRLHWETGVVGQVLYLEAEAAGVRATGMGCFFDDLVHELCSLSDLTCQSLYHFTVGGAGEDARLRPAPPYSHLR